jgi:hypothetical protein
MFIYICKYICILCIDFHANICTYRPILLRQHIVFVPAEGYVDSILEYVHALEVHSHIYVFIKTLGKLIYVYIYVYTYVYIYVCIYICIYIYIYVNIYIYIYIYI